VVERTRFTCPVCGDGNADATYKRDRYGRLRWFVGCKSVKCEADPSDWLRRFAEKVGTPGGGAVLSDPRPYLVGLPSRRRSVAAGRVPELPSEAKFAGWARRLLSSPEPLSYLIDERGLSLDLIERYEIGWDGKRLTFPMYEGGELVAYKTREPRAGAQMRSCRGAGRRWPLYPEPEGSWVILTAGELDALRVLEAGLPACSVTLGAGKWREDWTPALRGRRVVVAFDNNETVQAMERTEALRGAGIDAVQLELRRLGLRSRNGDLSDFLNGGSSPSRLRRAALGRTA
jgi:hypothetical protein